MVRQKLIHAQHIKAALTFLIENSRGKNINTIVDLDPVLILRVENALIQLNRIFKVEHFSIFY